MSLTSKEDLDALFERLREHDDAEFKGVARTIEEGIRAIRQERARPPQTRSNRGLVQAGSSASTTSRPVGFQDVINTNQHGQSDDSKGEVVGEDASSHTQAGAVHITSSSSVHRSRQSPLASSTSRKRRS
ncbi:MAG: hypothetical protein MMC33_009631 [Icmadophila ericetorum]|nr:hypothetical protein [Icmadophila ericetorum]